MRALEKDRTRRYETAIGFAEDIQRYLQHEPVEAGPPGSLYRLRKFMRRNRVWVVTGSLVVTALVAGIVMTSLAMFRAIDMQEKADIAAADAKKEASTSREAVQRMLTAVGDKRLRDVPLMDGLRRELLEEALEFNKRFLADSQSREDRMEVGHAHVRAASIYEMLEQSENAATSHKEARNLFEQLSRAEPDNSDAAYWLAEVNRRIATAYFEDDNFVKAEPALRRCVKQFEAVRTISARSAVGKAISLRTLGLLLHMSGKKANAEKALSDSLSTIKAIDSPDETTRFEKTATITALGNHYADSQRSDKAFTSFKAAVDSYVELAAANPRDRSFREALANSRDRLGAHHRLIGQHKHAKKAFEDAIREFRQLATDFPQIPEYRLDVARCRRALAISTALGGGDIQGALTEFLTAAEDLRLLAEDFPHVVRYQDQYSDALKLVSTHYSNMVRWKDAEAALIQAITIQETLSARSPEVTRYKLNIAELEYRLALARYRGDPDDPGAVPALEKAIRISKPLAGTLKNETIAGHALAKCYRLLAEIRRDAREFDEAERTYRSAIDIQRAIAESDPDSEERPRTLAITIHDMGRVLLERVLWESRDEPLGTPPSEAARQKLKKAETFARESLEIRAKTTERFPGRFDHPFELAMSHHLLGRIRHAQQDFARSIDQFNDCNKQCEELEKSAGTRQDVSELLLMSLRSQVDPFISSGDIDSAEAICDKADSTLAAELKAEEPSLRLKKRALQIVSQRGVCLVVRKELDKAADTLRSLADKYPTDSEASYSAGVAAATCVKRLSGNETEADRFATLAINLLKQSIDRGYDGTKDLADHLDWRSVASKDDFKALVSDSATTEP